MRIRPMSETVGDTVEIGEITSLADGVIIIGDGVGAPTTLAAFTSATGALKSANGGAGTVSGIMKANGSGVVSAATGGTDYAQIGANTFTGNQTLGSGVDLIFSGTTGQSEIHVTDNLADALSIKIAAGADILVIDSTDSNEKLSVLSATTQKLGFYGVTPVVQPSAYTQTAYSTADKTHAAFTSADIGAFTGGVTGFVDAAERDNIRTQFNALRADLADLKQLVNSVIDDLQALGLIG